MNQDKIDELQEEMRRKTEGPKRLIEEAEEVFTEAVKKENEQPK